MTAADKTRSESMQQADGTGKALPPGRIRLRVRANETDPYGIAHHSNYGVWAELALRDYLMRRDADRNPVCSSGAQEKTSDSNKTGIDAYRILRLQCKYMISARFDDLLEALVVPAGRHGGIEVFRFQINDCEGRRTLAAGRMETGCVSRNGDEAG